MHKLCSSLGLEEKETEMINGLTVLVLMLGTGWLLILMSYRKLELFR